MTGAQLISLPPLGSDLLALLAQGLSGILERPPIAEEIEKLQRYLQLLLQWNRTHRLTGYRLPEEIVQKLLLDSLLFLKVLSPSALKLLDFGAGAGIPGIPLKIVSPKIALTLVEARRNRTSFLAAVLRELRLQGATLLIGRAESLLRETPELQGSFDAILTRAAGRLETIIPVVLRFLRPEGVVIASGPPIRGAIPPLPKGLQSAWKDIFSPFSPYPRRFLVIQKVD